MSGIVRGGGATRSQTFTSTAELQASAANYEDIVHGLGNQYPAGSVMVQPTAGDYADDWINGEGVITVEYLDANTVRLYNESGVALPAGRVKITLVG